MIHSLIRTVVWPLVILLVGLGGCASPSTIDDPLATLSAADELPSRQLRAMSILDENPDDEAYQRALHRAVWFPGYTVDVREAAVDRLKVEDLPALQRTIAQQLPRLTAIGALRRLCEVVADEGWVTLTPALVSSLARVSPDPLESRPEYQAIERLHGPGSVPDVTFDLLVTTTAPSRAGLRWRCWDLIVRLGEADRLRELLRNTDPDADDAFLADLVVGVRELGILPTTSEEVRWVRKLRSDDYAAFWSEAVAGCERLDESRRDALELRDLAVVVSAARHDAPLLTRSSSDIRADLETALRDQRHTRRGSNFDNSFDGRDRLYEYRDDLTWGDLAAMTLARRALSVPQVVDHLFDYAERDRQDRTTEYGGVIALDERGRFEILEFPPRRRRHDQEFIASQAMFDAAYTALFHFHYHVQRERNGEYAGPGFGDLNYADSTRANCLVLTSVGRGRMNVDFYRHGRVQVDLGEITQAGP